MLNPTQGQTGHGVLGKSPPATQNGTCVNSAAGELLSDAPQGCEAKTPETSGPSGQSQSCWDGEAGPLHRSSTPVLGAGPRGCGQGPRPPSQARRVACRPRGLAGGVGDYSEVVMGALPHSPLLGRPVHTAALARNEQGCASPPHRGARPWDDPPSSWQFEKLDCE